MIASLGSAVKAGLSIGMELSVSAIAAVRKPKSFSLPIGASSQVHGTRNTDPMDTLTARRLSGSQEVGVSSHGIYAERRQPNERLLLCWLYRPRRLSLRYAGLPGHTSSRLSGVGRRMAQRTPRVRVYPVSVASNSLVPV